jgi:Type I restriction modification DNA specificity domain
MAELRQAVWLRLEDVPPLPRLWRALPTEEACIQLKPGKLFDSKTVRPSGGVPVLNQSETGFLGYHDEEPGVLATPDAPVVTFANHTCAMRLMKRPFSAIQNIFPKIGKPGITDTLYFYYASLGRVGLSDYKGHHPIFRQAQIPIPPLPVQRRIAGILSAYDEMIDNSRRRIEILEAVARALYREWFVHFRFPGHEDHPRVDSPLGEIPEGWEVKRVPKCIDINPRTAVSREGVKPFVPMGCLSNDSMLIADVASREGKRMATRCSLVSRHASRTARQDSSSSCPMLMPSRVAPRSSSFFVRARSRQSSPTASPEATSFARPRSRACPERVVVNACKSGASMRSRLLSRRGLYSTSSPMWSSRPSA